MTNKESKMIIERMIPKLSRGDGKLITHLMAAEALNLAIKAFEQIEEITKFVDKLQFEDVSQDEFEGMLDHMTFGEIKSLMWKMYCFAMDIQYTVK